MIPEVTTQYDPELNEDDGLVVILNGYRFEYDAEIRAILKQFGTDEATVDETEVVEYVRSHTEEIDLAGEIETWRDDLIKYRLDELAGGSSDPND